jgi:hypothetical protein
MSDEHMGSSIDECLREEGILDEAQTQVIEEVAAWQLAGLFKSAPTSRSTDSRTAGRLPARRRATAGTRRTP